MKKLNLLYLLISALIFGSCNDDTFAGYGEYSEGEPAMLVGSIKVPAEKKISSRALGQERETAIEQLAIIAWEINSGRKMAVDLTDKVANRSWTSDGASIYDLTTSIPVFTGRYRAYFIANWKSYYGRKNNTDGAELTFEELEQMSEEEIQQITFWNYGDHIDIYGNDGFPMTQVFDGVQNGGKLFEIVEGDNTLKDIYLTRASAHISFKIYNGNDGLEAGEAQAQYTDGNEPNFVPQRFAVFRAPSHTNAFKEGESQVQILKDNTFDQGYFPVTAQPDADNEIYYEFDFHMLENRQPVVEGLNSIADRERWNHNATTPNADLGREALSYSDRKFTNAPEGATFVVVEGTYSGPANKDENNKYTNDKYIGNVTYIIHLGNFNTNEKAKATAPENHPGSFGDFSVLRNELQEIKIHVQGARSILVNVNVSTPEEENSAIEGDISRQPVANLDAHYSKVMLEIDKNAIKSNLEENTVAITSFKNGFTNTEYTLAQLENAALDIDYKWVQFQKPTKGKDEFPQYAGVDNHSGYNETTEGYGYITDLIHDLSDYVGGRKTTLKYAVDAGDLFYIAAFVDDNVYKLYDNQEIQIKEWAGVNVKDRRIALNPAQRKVSPNGTSILSGIASINIRQKPVISTYSLNQNSFSGYNPFGLEQVMEPTATIESLTKGITPPTINGYTMEVEDNKYYGEYKDQYDKKCYWWDSPKIYTEEDQLYETGIEETASQQNTRDLFPAFDNGEISDDYTSFYKKTASGSYEFVPAEDYITVTKALVVHNRDLNGDGLIKGDELLWYVPGYVQLLIFNYGYNLIPEDQRLQQRAVEIRLANLYPTMNNFDKVFPRYLTSSSGIRRVYWQEQRGASSYLHRPGFTTEYGGDYMPTLNRLRLARNLGQFEGAATGKYTYMSQHNYAGDENHKNNIRYLNPNIARNYNVTGFYPFHYCTDELNYLPYALEYCTTRLEIWNSTSSWPNDNLRATVYKEDGKVDYEASAKASQDLIYKYVIEKYNENSNLTSTYGRATNGKLPAGWRVPNQRELLSMFVVKVPYDQSGSLSAYKLDEYLSCTFIRPDLYTPRYNIPVILSRGVITLPEGYQRSRGYVILVRDVDPYTGEPIAESKAVEYSGKVGRGILKH